MPIVLSGSYMMDEDGLIQDVFSKFLSSHEQTYEEFCSTFTCQTTGPDCLPGEVEGAAPGYIPCFSQHTQLDFKMTASMRRQSPDDSEEVSKDEVQPFSLDEDFDYDNVTLSPKYSEAELQIITETAKHRRHCLDFDTAETKD